MVDSTGNLVVSSTRQIAMVGIENLLVVDTPDALLIAKRASLKRSLPSLSP